MKDHKQLAELLKAARYSMGLDAVKAMLPAPFNLYLGAHDTGIHPYIAMQAPDHPSLTVWKASVWYGSQYEFNDRGQWFGVNPETPWVEPTLEQFFGTLEKLHAEALADRAMGTALRQAQATESSNATIEYYRKLIKR